MHKRYSFKGNRQPLLEIELRRLYGGTEATCSAALQTYSVIFQSGGNGTVTGTTAQTVNYNASTTEVTAVPSADYRFVNWTGTGGFVAKTTNPLTVTKVTSDQSIIANFANGK